MFISKFKPRAPLYSTLSNLECILDATGLRTSTDNTYGTLSNNTVQVWKSITPAPTSRDFTEAGTGPGFTGSPGQWLDGFIQFGGAVRYVHNLSSVWNFMHYNAVIGNLKWTAHMVLKIGRETNPDWLYGLFGNNASSAGNRGIHVRFEDRPTSSRSKGLATNISKGSAGFILEANPDNLISPNVPFVLTIETDMSQAAADRQKFYIDGVLFAYTTISTSTAVVSGPTYDLEISGIGNAAFSLHGWISHFILQSTIESSGVRNAFINSLIPFTRNKGNMSLNVDESRSLAQATFLSESIYYLNVAVERNPVTGNILCVFGQWTSAGHSWADGNVAMFRKSTDNAKTFATKATAFDPGANRGIIDLGFFYDSTGRGHGFTNTMDGTGTTSTAGTSKIFYFYTDDDGTTWNSSQVTTPVDGLDFTACYGNGYEANGYNWFTVYRIDTGAANSARYILKWAVGSNISTIQWILVESGTTYINEGTIAYLGGQSHVLVCRNESTLEWTQYYTDDDWATNTNQGDLTFGESNTTAGPARISKFKAKRSGILIDVLKCTYPLRGTPNLKAIYALPSAIISSGKAGWISGTKETITTDTEIIHYGGMYHIDFNDGNGPTYNFFAVYTREVVASVTSTLISFQGPCNQYSANMSALGI